MTPSTILVLQMAHVASVSWSDAIRRAMPDAEVHHMHALNPKTAQRLSELMHRAGPTQTFANVSARRGIARTLSPEIREKNVRDGKWCGGPVKVVTGIRDPIDHAASALFFFADFYGHTTLGLSHRDGASPSALISFFLETWQAGLAGNMGPNTFEASLREEFVRIRSWFSTEIEEVFGIDVRQFPFDRERSSQRTAHGATELFCYRFEDLPSDRPAWAKLAQAASEFLGAPIVELPRLNTTSGRRARDLYRDFKEQLTVPEDILDAVYSEPVLSHFYSGEELAAFKARWS
jgi:hypothetical protein